MIFDDLQKLLLYQQLNLGHECSVCKKVFHNKPEYSQHIVTCKNETLKCDKCAKTFGNKQIFKLHQQLHSLSESTNEAGETQSETLILTDNKESPTSNQLRNATINETCSDKRAAVAADKKPQCRTSVENVQNLTETLVTNNESTLPYSFKFFESPKKTASRVSRITKEKPKAANKRIGLTKVRIEDCLRCDDCSCIYIDDKDYYKHMRNFHKLDVNNLPIPQPKSKKTCKSCCRQCRGVNCTSSLKRPRATQPASNLIFKINMRDSIKNRWSRMVSQQMSESELASCPTGSNSTDAEEMDVKPDLNELLASADPEHGLDLSHLLSQVEVKIKTEPEDDYFT